MKRKHEGNSKHVSDADLLHLLLVINAPALTIEGQAIYAKQMHMLLKGNK